MYQVPDAVALGNYDIDIHNPRAVERRTTTLAPAEYYTIPYRALLPRQVENMLVAGRCISVTHEAQASIRIMPVVCCIGQAPVRPLHWLCNGNRQSAFRLAKYRLRASTGIKGEPCSTVKVFYSCCKKTPSYSIKFNLRISRRFLYINQKFFNKKPRRPGKPNTARNKKDIYIVTCLVRKVNL
ncbi:MAG: FAD-dependent oxidoreductase [[Clostridium] leptum]